MVRRAPIIARPVRALLLLSAMAMQLSAALAGEVTASVSRTSVVEGETLTLVLQTSDPQQSLEADFSVLAEDFDVLDQRSETQMSTVNGRQSANVRILVTLEPRRSGRLVVPALQFPGAATGPIAVMVEPAPEPAPGEAPPVLIEISVEPEQGPYYVHAQLSLTVRIFYQQNLTEAAINPPAPQPASVRLLDEIPFQSERDGKRYRVLERHYAIFPERSGDLVIPPLQLTGRLVERPADRLWQPSLRGRRVRIESEPLTVTVQPRPSGFPGEHWLPARRMTMSQQISDADSLRVGEPVTRTVILDAVGLEEHMIEEPPWPTMESARIYPDQPQGISRDDGRWVLGHKEFRYAVVPEQAGELVLPEIRLEWWDTVADRQRTAVLPEHRVQVAPAEPVPAAAVAAPLSDSAGQRVSDPRYPGTSGVNGWRLLSALLGLSWLVTLLMYLRKPAPPERSGDSRIRHPQEESELAAQIRQACKDGDAAAARNLLHRWSRRHGPAWAHGSILEFAAGLEDGSLFEAIQRLDAGSYSTSPSGEWDGRDLWAALDRWRRGGAAKRGNRAAAEPDLYARAR